MLKRIEFRRERKSNDQPQTSGAIDSVSNANRRTITQGLVRLSPENVLVDFVYHVYFTMFSKPM